MPGLQRRQDEPEPYNWSPAFELMLDEARRSIDRQLVSVREARQRAGSLLGYASLVAAALGFSAARGEFGLLGWIAVGAFLLVGAATTYVLYPRQFYQDLRAATMDTWFDDPSNTGVDHMRRSTAFAHDENYMRNHPKVIRLHRGISVAVIGLVVETAALAVRLVV